MPCTCVTQQGYKEQSFCSRPSSQGHDPTHLMCTPAPFLLGLLLTRMRVELAASSWSCVCGGGETARGRGERGEWAGTALFKRYLHAVGVDTDSAWVRLQPEACSGHEPSLVPKHRVEDSAAADLRTCGSG